MVWSWAQFKIVFYIHSSNSFTLITSQAGKFDIIINGFTYGVSDRGAMGVVLDHSAAIFFLGTPLLLANVCVYFHKKQSVDWISIVLGVTECIYWRQMSTLCVNGTNKYAWSLNGIKRVTKKKGSLLLLQSSSSLHFCADAGSLAPVLYRELQGFGTFDWVL